jgi:hypothetical protein
MVISSNYSLIPYPAHHYPIEPYIPKNAVAHQHAAQESIPRHNRSGKPGSTFKMSAIHCDMPYNRYDASQCLHYPDADQVGRLIDIYA